MAEDKEGSPPQRPVSRGPRVVTGDMKRSTQASRVVTGPSVSPPAGDDTAETVVGPASPPPPPPPPTPTPTRSRRRGTSAPPPEAEAELAGAAPAEPTEPEPWRPIEVTRNIPAAVHRADAPPPPPAGKAPKPGRPPTAGGGAGEKGSLAGIALVLALVSLVSGGVLAIVALVVAGKAKKRGGKRGLITAARLVAVLSLAAWLAVAGVVIANLAAPDGVDYAKLEAGDCIDTPAGTEVRRLTVRPCDKPHDAEVFAVVIHPAGPGDAFPGATALLEYAANACLGQPFVDYVGIPRGQSQLTEFEIVPESEAWAEGRRGLVCAVDNADRSPLTASIKGSGR